MQQFFNFSTLKQVITSLIKGEVSYLDHRYEKSELKLRYMCCYFIKSQDTFVV